jgi:hypothetical protein
MKRSRPSPDRDIAMGSLARLREKMEKEAFENALHQAGIAREAQP